jgi:carbonic anhydrase/acetyltransferase-like protein (isoleucine patch superfamily)
VTGMNAIASVTLANSVTIPAGAYIAGDVSNFRIHSGVVLAIGD